MKIFSNFVALFGVSVGVGNRKGGFVTRIIPAIKMIAEKIRENKKYIMNFTYISIKCGQNYLPDIFLIIVNLCPRNMAARNIVNKGLVKIKVMASPTFKKIGTYVSELL